MCIKCSIEVRLGYVNCGVRKYWFFSVEKVGVFFDYWICFFFGYEEEGGFGNLVWNVLKVGYMFWKFDCLLYVVKL